MTSRPDTGRARRRTGRVSRQAASLVILLTFTLTFTKSVLVEACLLLHFWMSRRRPFSSSDALVPLNAEVDALLDAQEDALLDAEEDGCQELPEPLFRRLFFWCPCCPWTLTGSRPPASEELGRGQRPTDDPLRLDMQPPLS